MYDAGVRICDIARTLGASHTAVSSYAYRNWTPAAAKGLTGRAQTGEEK